jgi:FkbM family methyltransferase
MNILTRLLVLKRRKQAAGRLRFSFHRAGDFKVPAEIRIGSEKVRLNLPGDEGTKTAFMDLLLDDCYHLRKFSGNIQTIMDVGAHAGLFSLSARLAFPKAKIHAYEPNPRMKPFYSNQAKIGGFTVFDSAVGLTEGKVFIDFSEDSVQTRVHKGEQGEIHCVSFANAVAELGGKVDLVKLDCEGGEVDILQDEKTWQNVRNLTMEFHLWAGYTLEELKARVSNLGLKVRYSELTGKDFGLLLAHRD